MVWACAGFRNMQRTVRRGREDDYGRSSLSATESPLEDHRMAGSDPRRRPKHYYYRELNEVPSLIRTCSISTALSKIAAPFTRTQRTKLPRREVLARANSDPAAILRVLGEPGRAGRREIFGRALRGAVGPRRDPLGDEPARPAHRGNPCLWGRFLRREAQRLGP
jgi:hypothetical protein